MFVMIFIALGIMVSSAVAFTLPTNYPDPLRLLYQKSVLIAIGTVGESTLVDTEDSTFIVNTELNIVKSYKDNKSRSINYYHYVFGKYTWDEVKEGDISIGDKVLIFLQYRDFKQSPKQLYQINVKKLDDKALKIYEQRLDELDQISHGKVSVKKLTEWLVRCGEHAETRFEAYLDLSYSAYHQTIKSTISPESVPDEMKPERGYYKKLVRSSVNEYKYTAYSLAYELTDGQRQRLIDAFLQLETLSYSDHLFRDLLAGLKDPRTVPVIVASLDKTNKIDAIEGLVKVLNQFAQDERIKELANDYVAARQSMPQEMLAESRWQKVPQLIRSSNNWSNEDKELVEQFYLHLEKGSTLRMQTILAQLTALCEQLYPVSH